MLSQEKGERIFKVCLMIHERELLSLQLGMSKTPKPYHVNIQLYECDVSCLPQIRVHYQDPKRNKNSGCVREMPSLTRYFKIMSVFLSFKGYFCYSNWRKSSVLDPKKHDTSVVNY